MSALCGAAQTRHADRLPGRARRHRCHHDPAGPVGHPGHLPRRGAIKALAASASRRLGTVSGLLLGRLLTQRDLFGLQWRPIFLMTCPSDRGRGRSAVLVRESRAPRPPPLDPVGFALISAPCFSCSIRWSRPASWAGQPRRSRPSPPSVPVLALFVSRTAGQGPADGSPLVELSLFRQRSFASASPSRCLLPGRDLVRADPDAVPADRPGLPAVHAA